MAKKARSARPRRAAAPADGFAAPANDMDIEEPEEAPRRRKQKEAPAEPLEHVIAKCPRAELEDLLLASARTNEPVTREDLEAAAARHAPPPKAEIQLGGEREGTGAFDAVDNQCLGHILEQLPTGDQLTMATVVCKSWRRLRTAKGLWTSFCLNEVPLVLRGGSQPIWPPIEDVLRNHTRERGPRRIRTVGAAQLIDWVADKDAVVELGVDTSEGALSPELASAAIMAFPNLRSLALQGKQILARTLRTRYPCQLTLRTLVVGDSVLSGVKAALRSFLISCKSLETLCCPSELATYEVLELASTAWKEARGGAAPLLSKLKLHGYGGYNADPFAVPAQVGSWFGNLETFSFSPRVFGADFGTVPRFEKMGRLKSVHIGPLARYNGNVTTLELNTLLAQLLAASPNVEHIWVQAGRANGTSDDDPLPRYGAHPLPPSLRVLDLMEVELAPERFVTHSLKELRLRDCVINVGEVEEFDLENEDGIERLEALLGCPVGEIPGFPDEDEDEDGPVKVMTSPWMVPRRNDDDDDSADEALAQQLQSEREEEENRE